MHGCALYADAIAHAKTPRVRNKSGSAPIDIVPANGELWTLMRKAQAEASISRDDIASGQPSSNIVAVSSCSAQMMMMRVSQGLAPSQSDDYTAVMCSIRRPVQAYCTPWPLLRAALRLLRYSSQPRHCRPFAL